MIRIRRKESSRGIVLAISLVLAAAFVASLIGSSQLTGQAIRDIRTPCNEVLGVDTWLQAQPASSGSGDQFCESVGYAYAAHVDKETSRILFDSSDGGCFSSGKIQVDEMVYYYKEPGSKVLTFSGSPSCIVQSASSFFSEPELGDQLHIDPRYPSALCCTR